MPEQETNNDYFDIMPNPDENYNSDDEYETNNDYFDVMPEQETNNDYFDIMPNPDENYNSDDEYETNNDDLFNNNNTSIKSVNNDKEIIKIFIKAYKLSMKEILTLDEVDEYKNLRNIIINYKKNNPAKTPFERKIYNFIDIKLPKFDNLDEKNEDISLKIEDIYNKLPSIEQNKINNINNDIITNLVDNNNDKVNNYYVNNLLKNYNKPDLENLFRKLNLDIKKRNSKNKRVNKSKIEMINEIKKLNLKPEFFIEDDNIYDENDIEGLEPPILKPLNEYTLKELKDMSIYYGVPILRLGFGDTMKQKNKKELYEGLQDIINMTSPKDYEIEDDDLFNNDNNLVLQNIKDYNIKQLRNIFKVNNLNINKKNGKKKNKNDLFNELKRLSKTTVLKGGSNKFSRWLTRNNKRMSKL